MLHGYKSCKESFYYQIQYFSKFFRVIALDITGFGASEKNVRAYTLNDYISDINGVLKVLKVEKYNLIAHSFGGRLAIKMCSMGAPVDKLVLTGSAGLKPRRTLKYYFKVLLYKILKHFVNSEKLKNFGSNEYRTLTEIEKQTYVNIVNEHLDNRLKYVKNKTLIIFGENDKDTPLYFAKKLNRKIKSSILYVIRGAGHFCFSTHHQEFNVLVSEFLKGE